MYRHIAAGVHVIALAVLFGSADSALAEKPLHERLTASAWEAFHNKDYKEAIRQAESCIDDFFGTADRRQQEINDKKERVPNGRVRDAKKKEAIFNNGPLNDVATCYYIVARAADKLGLKEKVAEAVKEAAKYPSARAWDPKGWFWSPAQAAERFRTHPELAEAPSELYVKQAWDEFNGGRNDKAIELADMCVQAFYDSALDMEQDLAKRGIRISNGRVDEKTKELIFENGLLNDVATCLYIKGQAARAAGDQKAAVAGYRKTLTLKRGRCWDPKGWFWSPAELAGDRLKKLR